MWNLKKKNDTNELILQMNLFLQNRNRLTHIENKFRVTKGERSEGREKLGVWD